MPRKPRFAPPTHWYHVTQRGNYRQKTFYSATDFQFYLDLLGRQADAHDVTILGYCLMANHIHLIARPNTEHALSACLRAVTGQYSQHLHARLRRHGHLWQGRFFSCLLGSEDYLATALRYVELNPVRARMVDTAAQYQWSSARAHTTEPIHQSAEHEQPWLAQDEFASRFTPTIWQERLTQTQSRKEATTVRTATYAERILGPTTLITQLETQYEIRLHPRPNGRPKSKPNQLATAQKEATHSAQSH